MEKNVGNVTQKEGMDRFKGPKSVFVCIYMILHFLCKKVFVLNF